VISAALSCVRQKVFLRAGVVRSSSQQNFLDKTAV
jgi:hypothetical protein